MGLQSFYTFGRFQKARQLLLLALFVQNISERNISWSVSQGKNHVTGTDCIVLKRILIIGNHSISRNHKKRGDHSIPTEMELFRLSFHDCVTYTDGTGGCDGNYILELFIFH